MSMPHKLDTRSKRADLASAGGAGILGAGVGALLLGSFDADAARLVAMGCIAIGIVLHGWGMLARHRLESGAAAPLAWNALYWLCWILLALLIFWIGVYFFGS
jgi:hypothetical protein